MLYATYVEGSASDQLVAAALDPAGHLYLAGQQSSPDFPSTGSISGFPPAGSNGGYFIAELSADGSHPIFSDTFTIPNTSGYIPSISGIVLDGQGNVYVAGTTDGTVFPTTPGAYLGARPGASLDAFVFLLNPPAGALVFSMLFGGSNADYLTRLALDSAGNLVLSGYTASTDLPVTAGAFMHSVAGENIFVAKLSPHGSSLQFCSLFGGSYNSVPSAMGVGPSGDVYIDGWSYAFDLPTSPGAYDTPLPVAHLGDTAFLARLDGQTGARVYLTYLEDPQGTGGPLFPASDGTVSVWESFYSGSISGGPPIFTPDALQPCVSPFYSEHTSVKHFSADGSQLLYGTLLDGILSLDASGIAQVSDAASLYRSIDLAAPQPPEVTCVVNAATHYLGPVTPGTVITVFGPSIGPDSPSGQQLTGTGLVASNLSGLQVLVGGMPAPILYASKNQINAVMPFGAPQSGNVTIEVIDSGATVGTFSAAAATASPGIFTESGSGAGPGVIFNRDGSLNSPGNPAALGSTLSIYVTGLGPLTPQPVDGFIPSAPFSKPALPIQVFLNDSGTTFPILSAGDVPGIVEGVQRIVVQLPTGPISGAIPPQICVTAPATPFTVGTVFTSGCALLFYQ